MKIKPGPIVQEARKNDPGFREWHDRTIERLQSEKDDLAVAVVGATLIEEQLADAIEFHFSKRSESGRAAVKRVVDRDMSTKISLGYAIGLYEETFLHDLTIIAWIRNKFAHNLVLEESGTGDLQPVTFELIQISNKCSELMLPEISWTKRNLNDSKDMFVASVLCIASELAAQKLNS